MTRRPTMRDVANAAGVSLMTVSRVVSGEPRVAPETIAKVEKAVRELGYQRDDIARNLRTKDRTSATIGLVLDDLANPFFATMARAVEDEARRRGYLVLVGSTNDELERERDMVSAFCAHHVDGLIVVPTAGSHTFLRARMKSGTKVVCVDRPAKGLDVDTVTVDNQEAAFRAVTQLLDHGHTRIAFLGDQHDIWTQQERFAGYLRALASRGIAKEPDLIRHGLRAKTDAHTAVLSVMGLPAPPTALFTSNDLITTGVVEGLGQLRQAGQPGTGSVALIGFDDVALADQLQPPLTVVSQDPAAIGTTAANLLFARIAGDESPPRSVVLLTRVVTRGSGELRPVAEDAAPRP
ncbi:LacI family DNA-binding transcriptional regulator [Catenulispora yoronensis]|uniref:LacI family DNA-binding transcriptional regulator n=1 Tax=Catenulispora yoronensis TaxID=450799 RepID=A0ABN2TK80_9ACTN